MDQLKGIGMQVFYTILKQHRRKLRPEMRILGDAYVKEEFRQAHQKANQEQYIEFLKRWAIYIEELDKSKQIGRDLTSEEKALLNEEQIENLYKLKEFSKQQKSE
ncbi:unnamed protein product [Paramecium primaurelia]|uniref:Succinate dehydrogenase assembly factor 3 n=2 Tax=Paramecium TaxID=5884 RepID=A0A8S1UTV5_9CILI|nr:unnamed protein product [Paramecium primaurelia]CAD8168550.1 unnamed protein product [Paramecium pentaurelia]